MKWYNQIAFLYDFFTTWIYKKPRKALVENLKIQKGDRVLVIACGTGQSFKWIEEKIGVTGEIIALDYSSKMLKQAQKRINKHHWKNIQLLQMDARDLSRKYLLNKNIDQDFDILIGELAFSVIPDWENVMKTSALLLKDEGRTGLMDWYRNQNDWLTKTVDFLAKAETGRNTMAYAQEIFDDFTVTDKFWFGNVYVGVGSRKNTQKQKLGI